MSYIMMLTDGSVTDFGEKCNNVRTKDDFIFFYASTGETLAIINRDHFKYVLNSELLKQDHEKEET